MTRDPSDPLAPPRPVAVEVVADDTRTARCDEGFLRMRRLTLRHRTAGGPASAPYRYDLVDRAALDAVAIVLAHRDGPETLVCLRSAVRPPLALRPGPGPGAPPSASQWEVPAGLIEAGESVEGCAAREALEEAGFRLPEASFEALGPPVTLAPGVLGELVHFRLSWIGDPEDGVPPPTDGHPVEADAELRFVALGTALQAAAAGVLADVKTELALHRLARRLDAAPDLGHPKGSADRR